jgi:type II secretory pathway pseudopilin PulG
MFGMFDSFAQIATLLLTGTAAVAVWLFKLWQGAKDREQQAKQQAKQTEERLEQHTKQADKQREVVHENQQREQEVVNEHRKNRRDSFFDTDS